MKSLVLLACLSVRLLAQTGAPSLSGTVTDPSGAVVPGALVQLRGPGGEKRAATDNSGHYSISGVKAGKYLVRVIAVGFGLIQRKEVEVAAPVILDLQLSIEAEKQVVNVEDEARRVSTDPSSNAGALVLGQKELEALSDDPDELSQQLQAMAGPGAGPNGGQIYIDGFTGGELPPKNSIREVRINSNPYAPEYDRPGFGRIEIFTKPGTDYFHGQGFFQFNDQYFNSRSPLLDSSLPPYKQLFFGGSLSGPIKKQKASFTLDGEHRAITENAFVLATTLDSNLNPQTVNQALVTPQTRTSVTPRLDYSINSTNTLVARYQYTRIGLDDQGVGSFNLASQAFNETSTENTLQITETAVVNTSLLAETRFQFLRSAATNFGAANSPAISVQGAFTSGGNPAGNSRSSIDRYELSNNWTLTHGAHSIKWGARLRHSDNQNSSLNNFNGTFSFFAGQGPELDANNQPISGTNTNLTALQVYQRTLLFEKEALSSSEIRALGGGASLFTLSGGTATTLVRQFDLGVFANDDWRIRPNLTLSYGLRYEAQTNTHDWADWSPRVAVAWGLDSKANGGAKTVLRAGLGIFYDRLADTYTLNALRYNGVTQQSYLITNPDFFPNIPSLSSLASEVQPQQLQLLYGNIKAPRTYQTSVGVDRQINKYARLSVNYISSRGVHLLRSRDINAPIDGIYPYGEQEARFLTESTGFSRTNQLFVSPTVNYKKMFLFGFYALSYGKDDNEGQPSDPYNLRAEWGPSSFGDVRHRMVMGSSLPLPWKISVSPFLIASSGSPYNITTGQDLFDDGVTTARPALLSSVSQSDCSGTGLVYEHGFGCFNLHPAPGQSTIERNYGRGPANVSLNLRLARTWSFGEKGDSGLNDGGPPPGMGGARGGGPPPGGGGPGGGGPPPGGGPPGGMFGNSNGKRFNLTLSILASNVLNHANYAAPSGDLSSPFFGQYLGITSGFGPPGASSGSATYNRKLSMQLRFTF